MNIKKIEWQNFASYGNKMQTIEFENGVGNFFLVLGQNGSGKSSISDVIKFALYGKLQNKKLRDIPNRFNSSAFCRIVLQKDAHTEIIIERGISPGILTCKVNGVEYDQAGKRNIQEFIEEEVLGMPFYVFNNIISLSINDFKSFLSMRPHDKRAIIDKIFNLEIINKIREHIRNELRGVKNDINLILGEVDVLTRSIESSRTELNKLQEQIQKKNEVLAETITNDINKYNKFLNEVIEKTNSVLEKESKLQNRINEVTTLVHNERHIIRLATEKERLYKNKQCPTCESKLDTNEHIKILEEYINKKAEATKNVEEYNTALKKFTEMQNKVLSAKQKLNEQRLEAKNTVSRLEGELKLLSDDNTSDEQTTSLSNIINETKTNIEKAKKRANSMNKKERFYLVLENIFGDKGVKQLAIKRILPALNMGINKVIKNLNMEYRVVFNEEFEAQINHLGHEVSPEMLSTGERKKIDFAVLISLIRLMKIKFAGMNLIFLDEIFSSVDGDGIHHILEILSDTCKELDLNIFVINHSTLPTEIFDYQLEVTKDNGFSDINLQKIK